MNDFVRKTQFWKGSFSMDRTLRALDCILLILIAALVLACWRASAEQPADSVAMKTDSENGTITVTVVMTGGDLMAAYWKDRPRLIVETFKRAEKLVKEALEIKLKAMKEASKKPAATGPPDAPKTRAEVVPLELEFK